MSLQHASTQPIDRYAVVGHPVKHSSSPLIHSLFAEQVGHQLEYQKIELPLDGFEQGIHDMLLSRAYSGLNVTVPFKERAWALCDDLYERARLAGAVNTLLLNSDGKIVGDNTDGQGLCCDLQQNHAVTLKGARILLVGAGGAVRGVLPALLATAPESIVIANRTPAKAEQLASLFAEKGRVTSKLFKELQQPYDIIINGTSASLSGQLPPLSSETVCADTVVYDMMYGAGQTPFNRWATETGARMALDGLGMLVEQAAEAFKIWRGVRPKTQSVIAAVRERIVLGTE